MAAGVDVDLVLDPGSRARLDSAGARFLAAVGEDVGRRLEAEASPTLQGMRQKLLGAPARTDVGLRQGIAAGIHADTTSGAGEAQLTIRATGDALPSSKQALVAAFNQPSFLHPVYGGRVSVSQSGRPYFGEVIKPREHQLGRAVQQGVDDALDDIGGSA